MSTGAKTKKQVGRGKEGKVEGGGVEQNAVGILNLKEGRRLTIGLNV